MKLGSMGRPTSSKYLKSQMEMASIYSVIQDTPTPLSPPSGLLAVEHVAL